MNNEFYEHPENLVVPSDVGDLYVQWFYDRYAALRLIQRMPIFEQAYELLSERGNFSRKNAFGEMHGDRYLWVEKHDKAKVLVHETQSQKFIFILTNSKFHIRQLFYEYDEPHKKTELKGVTIKSYREADFTHDVHNPKVFKYGDARDIGYVASLDTFANTYYPAKIDSANAHTLWGINQMEYWKYYLDNPEELE